MFENTTNGLSLKIRIIYFIIGIFLSGRLLLNSFPEALYYGTIFALFLHLYFEPTEIILKNKTLIIFLAILFFSILLNQIPSFFKPGQRFLAFVLNMILFAPVFISSRLLHFRSKLFLIICQLFSLYTILSFVGLLAGIFPVMGFGGFQGITVHAMSMSVVAAVSFLFNVALYLRKRKKLNFIIILISVIILILGASRAALLGSILGFTFLLLKYNHFSFKAIRSLAVAAIIGIAIIVLLPASYFGKLTQKFESSDEAGSALSTRETLWESRLLEFKESPVYGIGFGNLLKKYNDYGINEETGGIETGSSWGMVLSMSGLLGFTTIFFLIRKQCIVMVKNRNSTQNSLIFGLMIFFIIHMFFEGYIFASGSIFMIFFWLTFSMTHYNFRMR